MFYFLSKAIDFIVMPLSIIVFLLLYGIIVKNRHRARAATALALVFLFVISNTFLVRKALNWWEQGPVNLSEVNGVYDVGVLLSGGMMDATRPGQDHMVIGKRGDRVFQTFLLYKAGKIKKILITGASAEQLLREKKGETRLAADALVKWGVPADDIMFEENARNTRENATFSAKILRAKFPAGRYLLITSAFHMRRSAGCFAKAGIQTATFPADFYGNYYELRFQDFLVPDANAVFSFNMLWHEWIGNIVYKVVGYT